MSRTEGHGRSRLGGKLMTGSVSKPLRCLMSIFGDEGGRPGLRGAL